VRLLERVTASDLFLLMWDDYGWSSDIGGLAICDGTSLLDRDGRIRIEAVRRQLEPRRHPVTACGPALARSLRLACYGTRRAGQPRGWPAARRLPAIGAWPRIERV
jgi:hypothetical protein